MHAAYVRLTSPRSYFLGLLIIELLMLVAATVLILVVSLQVDPIEWLVGVVLSLSLTMVYLLCFVGVAHDSPTLALINTILDFGTDGMPVEKITEFIERHPFVAARLNAMHDAGFIKSDGGRIVLGAKTAGLLQLALRYKRFSDSARTSG